MKFFLVLAAAIASAAAQSAFILSPKAGDELVLGQNNTITIARPNQLTPTREVAIALTLANCVTDRLAPVSNATVPASAPSAEVNGTAATSTCTPAMQAAVLYAGSFAPKQVPAAASANSSEPVPWLPPYQNFTIFVPATGNVVKGKALLVLDHWALVGAGPMNLFETKNITVNIV